MRVQDFNDKKESIEGRLCIDGKCSLQTALGKMRRWHIHHLYVLRDEVTIGLVSDRDIFEKGLMSNGIQLNPVLTVNEIFSPQRPVVRGDDDLSEVARVMLAHGTDGVLVKLEGQGFGILTANDLLKHLEGSSVAASSSSAAILKQAAHNIAQNPIVQSAAKILADAGI